jgi:hypothetical protein
MPRARPNGPLAFAFDGLRVANQAALELSRSTSLSVQAVLSAENGMTSACSTWGRRGRNRSRNTSTNERAGLERTGFELVRA